MTAAGEPMSQERETLKPVEGANRALRRRLTLKDELLLALLPTGTVLAMLGLVEALSNQRLLFASLSSSAFLIYLDPLHNMNSVKTLVASHLFAATAGLLAYLALGHTYPAGAIALIVTILLMILLDVVHPPAVSTALGFALRSGDESNLLLFSLAVGIVTVLVVLERSSLGLIARMKG